MIYNNKTFMKKKITVTIDEQILNMLKEHLNNLKVGNKSNFIENLIKKEIKNIETKNEK
jgi:metal-responsive CopG/Arc/MetJ family transcriptional regulator